MSSRLAQTLVLVAGLVPAFVGCSSPAGDTTSTSTGSALTIVDAQLANVADVETDDVSFPAAAAESTSSSLSQRQAGDFIVSPRGAATSKNPSGFFRQVTSRVDSTGQLVFGTQAAQATALIKEGSADSHLSIPNVDEALQFAQTDIMNIDEDMGDFVAGLKGIRLEAHGQLNSGSVSFHPDLEVKTAFHDAALSELRVVATGDFAAALDVQMTLKVDGTLGVEALNYLQTIRLLTWQKRLYSSPTWALPTQWIGGFPVEESVQMYVNAICSVRMNAFTGGELDVRATGNVASSLQVGEDYENGSWSTIGNSSFTGSASLDISKGASVDVTCQIAPSFALRFYDVVGPELGVGPDVHFKVATNGFGDADSATTWEVDPGANAWLKGDAQFLGLSKSLGPYQIYNWTGAPLISGLVGAGSALGGSDGGTTAADAGVGSGDDGGSIGSVSGDDDAGDDGGT